MDFFINMFKGLKKLTRSKMSQIFQLTQKATLLYLNEFSSVAGVTWTLA